MGVHTAETWIRVFLALFLLILLLLVTSPLYSAEPGVSQSAMLANSCAGCHGTDGNSPGSIPSIAGKSPAFIEQALKEFRDGSRQSTVMGRHAKGYSDKEISLIGEFFSNSK